MRLLSILSLLISSVLMLAGCGSKTPVAGPVTAAPPAGVEGVELSPESRRNAGIEIVTAREEARDTVLEAPGQLAWNEERTWTVGVVATGKVRLVSAHVGDRVKAGQVLARFHTHDVHDTQANLTQAFAERRRAAANLEQLKRNRDRLKRLYEAKAAPLMQVEQAESDIKMAEEEVQKAHADIERETQHLTEVLDVPVEPEHAHAGPHKGEGAEVELVPVKAPHDGLVVERRISLGTVVTTGQPAYVITDPATLWLVANFPESALPLLRVGLPVTMEVRAYPGRQFSGRIRRLGESLDAETRTLKVIIEVASQGALKPEMFATVKFAARGARALVVPASALQEVDGQQVVYVEEASQRFVARPVRAVVSSGVAVIQSGLTAGERVAAQGSYMIKGHAAQKAGE